MGFEMEEPGPVTEDPCLLGGEGGEGAGVPGGDGAAGDGNDPGGATEGVSANEGPLDGEGNVLSPPTGGTGGLEDVGGTG
ncbi:MAG: hypothetical protein N2C14_04365, partial [Planctomycetales bacterium]